MAPGGKAESRKNTKLHPSCRLVLLLESGSVDLVETGHKIALLLRQFTAHAKSHRVDMNEVIKWLKMEDEDGSYIDVEKFGKVLLKFVNEGLKMREDEIDNLLQYFDPKGKGKVCSREFHRTMKRAHKSLLKRKSPAPQEEEEVSDSEVSDAGSVRSNACTSSAGSRSVRSRSSNCSSSSRRSARARKKLVGSDEVGTAFGKQLLSDSASCSSVRFSTSARFPARLKQNEHMQALGPGVYEIVEKHRLSGSRSASAFSVGRGQRPPPHGAASPTKVATIVLPTINMIGTHRSFNAKQPMGMGGRVLFRDTFAQQERRELGSSHVGPASYQHASSGGQSLDRLLPSDLKARRDRGQPFVTQDYGWGKIDASVTKHVPTCSFGTDEKSVNKRANYDRGRVGLTVQVPVAYDGDGGSGSLDMMGAKVRGSSNASPNGKSAAAACSHRVNAPAFSMSARSTYYHPQLGVNRTSPYYAAPTSTKSNSKVDLEETLRRRQQRGMQAHMRRFQPHIS